MNRVVNTERTTDPVVRQACHRFARLYYKMLNEYVSYLYKFYAEDSTLTVTEIREDRTQFTLSAQGLQEVQQLLIDTYESFNVLPVASSGKKLPDGNLELKMSGTIFSQNPANERRFEQTITLKEEHPNSAGPQTSFYVKSDQLVVYRPDRQSANNQDRPRPEQGPSQSSA